MPAEPEPEATLGRTHHGVADQVPQVALLEAAGGLRRVQVHQRLPHDLGRETGQVLLPGLHLGQNRRVCNPSEPIVPSGWVFLPNKKLSGQTGSSRRTLLDAAVQQDGVPSRPHHVPGVVKGDLEEPQVFPKGIGLDHRDAAAIFRRLHDRIVALRPLQGRRLTCRQESAPGSTSSPFQLGRSRL